MPASVLRANSPAYVAPRVAPLIRRLGLHAFVYQGTHDDVALGVARALVRELRSEGATVFAQGSNPPAAGQKPPADQKPPAQKPPEGVLTAQQPRDA